MRSWKIPAKSRSIQNNDNGGRDAFLPLLLNEAIEFGAGDGDGLRIVLVARGGPGTSQVGGLFEHCVAAPLQSNLSAVEGSGSEPKLADGEPGGRTIGREAGGAQGHPEFGAVIGRT